MFVDALDSEFYEQHHLSGLCYLSLSKVSPLLRGYIECCSLEKVKDQENVHNNLPNLQTFAGS